jgi:hypothetical protein
VNSADNVLAGSVVNSLVIEALQRLVDRAHIRCGKLTLSDTISRTKPWAASLVMRERTRVTTLPLRCTAPMMGVLFEGHACHPYRASRRACCRPYRR